MCHSCAPVIQPFRRFTYDKDHSPTLPLLHLRHSSFSNPSFASPTSQLFTYEQSSFYNISVTSPRYITTHSPTLPSLYLCHCSFSNPSIASSTSQLILQPFFRLSYVTALHLRHLASRPWFIIIFLLHRVLNTRHYEPEVDMLLVPSEPVQQTFNIWLFG